MGECESLAIKKAQHQKCDSFKLGWWRRLFRVLWTVRRSNQSILKETNPEYSLEGLMLKLKLQYFWLPDMKHHLIGKDPDVEKQIYVEGKRKRWWQRVKWLDSITNSMDMNLSKLREIVKDGKTWYVAVQQLAKSQTQLSDWIKTTPSSKSIHSLKHSLWSSFSLRYSTNDRIMHELPLLSSRRLLFGKKQISI